MAKPRFVFAFVLVSALVLSLSLGGPIYAVDAPTTTTTDSSAAHELIISNISLNCASIKQSLSQLQRADSRTRTYLGTAYESVFNKFIKPLNLRLIKNDLHNSDLLNLQSDFSAAQTEFRNAYTAYMRDLDTLISMDCEIIPETFYEQLVATRTSRATLRSLVIKLNGLTHTQYQSVEALKGSL